VQNRNGLIGAAKATPADGYAEREAALLMLKDLRKGRRRRITLGAKEDLRQQAPLVPGPEPDQSNGPSDQPQSALAGREGLRLAEADRTIRQVKLRGLRKVN
jgi:hypothetical protein